VTGFFLNCAAGV